MSDPLVKTRFTPPVEAGSLLPRARLQDLSEKLVGHKLSVLQAPAGSGKTSLMCQWYQSLKIADNPIGWLSMDPSGLTPIDLLAYIGAAMANALPQYRQNVDALIESRRYQTSELRTTALVNMLADAGEPVVLFVDDLHWLDTGAIAQLARFLELVPAELSMVVSSRTIPELGQAVARARGQLQEIGMEDLRFTADETRAYIESAGWGNAGPEAIRLLEQRTDGWITGIKLANLALRHEPARDTLLRDYSGSHHDVSDYFAEQVLSTLSDAVRQFLLKTSVLERFCAELCDHMLTSRNSRRTLDEIEHAGLFLSSLDDERRWYRYHPLFRDFLYRRLRDEEPETEEALLLGAADWCHSQGELVEAIELTLKADKPERAAEILESCSQDWTYKGRISLVTRFIENIPDHVLEQFPTVLLTWAWHLMRHLRFEEARNLLGTVKKTIEDWEQADKLPAADLGRLRHQLLHREMTLAAAQDDSPLVEKKCKQMLSFAEQDLHPYLRGSVYAQLLYAQREQFRLKDLELLAAKARGVLDRSGYDFALIAVLSIIGSSLFSLGKADTAIQVLEDAVKVAVRYGGELSPLVALPGLPMSAALYERNDVNRAEEILARHLAYATDWGFVDQFVAGYVTQARILALYGERDEAFRVLDEGMALALDRNLERLRLSLVAEKLRLYTQSPSDSASKVLRFARSAGIPSSPDDVLPKVNRTSIDELRALSWLRVAMSNDAVAEAAHVAKNWRTFCEARGAQLSYVRWTILLAHLQLLKGDNRAAQRILREAIAAAVSVGAVRSFVDEGPAIRTLIEACCSSEFATQSPTDMFALHLLAACGGTVQNSEADRVDPVCGSLTERELEVLQQVSTGMRNREVAERLGMTEGSIKWYLQQVFDKLGTRSRLQAVERARKLGLIQ